MATNTPNINLYKKDMTEDGNDTFNITTMLNDNWDKIDIKFGQQDKDFIRQPAFLSATSTNNVYTATSTPEPTAYVDGMGIVLKADKDSTDAVTLNWNELGSKALKDVNGNNIKLKANGIYSFRYNFDTGNFISQAKGGAGNATADTILNGYTASADIGDITGNIPIKTSSQNTSSIQKSVGNYDGLGITAYLMPPKGYYDGTALVYSKENDLITDNIKAGKTIFGVNGKSSVVETNDAVATSSQILAPQTAYVNGNKITGSMVNQSSQVTAINVGSNGTNKYFRIPQGAYLTNASQGYPEIIASATQIDSNIVTSNIKAGASICGVSGKSSVVDTSDATATLVQIRNGQTAYVNGTKITGTLSVQATATQTITPTTSDIIKNAGIYDGAITVKGDSNLTTSNIKAGTSIFGVSGKSSVVDTADATALTADKIINGYSAYANGSKVNGNATISSLGGKRVYSGTVHVGNVTKTFTKSDLITNFNLNYVAISKTALGFTPNVIIFLYNYLAYATVYVGTGLYSDSDTAPYNHNIKYYYQDATGSGYNTSGSYIGNTDSNYIYMPSAEHDIDMNFIAYE